MQSNEVWLAVKRANPPETMPHGERELSLPGGLVGLGPRIIVSAAMLVFFDHNACWARGVQS